MGVDPRGVGLSDPLQCLEPGARDVFLAVDPTPESKSEVRALRAAYRTLGEGCKKTNSTVAAHLSSVEVARDLDIVRALLGQRKLHFYGASYGTQIGANYAHLFPERTGQMVLDGAVDPSRDLTTQAKDQAIGFDRALRRALADCIKNTEPNCPLGKNVKEGIDSVQAVLGVADLGLLKVPDGDRPVGEGEVTRALAWSLYDTERWPQLSEALVRAAKGNGNKLREMADNYDGRGPSGFVDNSAVAYPAIRCADFVAEDDFDKVARRGLPETFARSAPVFGRFQAWSAAHCSAWPIRSAVRQGSVRAPGVTSIVVIGTTQRSGNPLRMGQGSDAAAGLSSVDHPRRRWSHRLCAGQFLCGRLGGSAPGGAEPAQGRAMRPGWSEQVILRIPTVSRDLPIDSDQLPWVARWTPSHLEHAMASIRSVVAFLLLVLLGSFVVGVAPAAAAANSSPSSFSADRCEDNGDEDEDEDEDEDGDNRSTSTTTTTTTTTTGQPSTSPASTTSSGDPAAALSSALSQIASALQAAAAGEPPITALQAAAAGEPPITALQAAAAGEPPITALQAAAAGEPPITALQAAAAGEPPLTALQAAQAQVHSRAVVPVLFGGPVSQRWFRLPRIQPGSRRTRWARGHGQLGRPAQLGHSSDNETNEGDNEGDNETAKRT